MNEIFYNMLALTGGSLIGFFFFGGLWITVKQGIRVKNPALWFLGSFIIRISAAMGGFYVIFQGNWLRLIISLIGFIVARRVMVRLTRPVSGKQFQMERREHET